MGLDRAKVQNVGLFTRTGNLRLVNGRLHQRLGADPSLRLLVFESSLEEGEKGRKKEEKIEGWQVFKMVRV
jgi:hypothetical protein